MRSDARSKPSSSMSDEGKFFIKPTSSRSPSSGSEQVETSPQKNSFHVSSRAKRHREETPQDFEPSTSKKKKGSGIDLEELLAQTYPKETSTPRTGEEEFRRSSRRRHRPANKPADVAKKWSADEDICVTQALLETSPAAGEVNLNAFYQRAKEKLQGEVSKSQLYDKMRTMSKRFRSIEAKLSEQNINEDMFAFRTAQEPALFKMWKQIWRKSGSNVSENEEANRDISQNNEGPNPNPGGTESDDGRRESSEEHDEHLQKPSLHETQEQNGISEGLEKGMRDMVRNTETRLQGLIESSLGCVVGLGFGGGCAWSGLSRRMKEMIEGVDCVEEFRGLSDEQAKELQQKWRTHKIHQLKLFSEYVGLLHTHCNSFLQNLQN